MNEIYVRARNQNKAPIEAYLAPIEAYLGINVAVIVLSEPENCDLLERLIAYCEEDAP